MDSAKTRYGGIAQLFHWLSALLIVAAVSLAFAMSDAEPGETQNTLFDLHRSIGATILAVTGARLLWRLFNPPPPPERGMPAWQERVARYTHRLLYLILIVLPLLGWAGTSAYRARIMIFGLFELPPILPENRALSEALLETHEILALTLCAILIVHAGAALHHHFVRKDDTLRRMLP
jgi:cytochrome b561